MIDQGKIEYQFHPAYEDRQIAFRNEVTRDRNPYASVAPLSDNANRAYNAWNVGWDAAATGEPT